MNKRIEERLGVTLGVCLFGIGILIGYVTYILLEIHGIL